MERLQDQGMTVAAAPTEMQSGLRKITAEQTQEWLARAGQESEQMLEHHRSLVSC